MTYKFCFIYYKKYRISINHNRRYILFDGKKYDKCEEISSISNDELLTKFKSIIENLCNNNLEQHLYAVPNAIKWKKYINNPNPNWWCIKIWYPGVPFAESHCRCGDRGLTQDGCAVCEGLHCRQDHQL